MKPRDVMAHPKFGWSDYLQDHLTSVPVVVSKLHPIMGLRLAALFVDLTEAGLATESVGQGRFQILSGVRTYEQQRALWEEICLRQRRCHMVANPDTLRGTDAEGIRRIGSNHQAQRQQDWSGTGAPIEVGYAVDIFNEAIRAGMSRAERAAAWAPLHARLSTYGLDWPLKGTSGAPLEEWHVEWFPRSAPAPLDGPVAWPHEPGVHRPLMRGMIGGDATTLQMQLEQLLGASSSVRVGVIDDETMARINEAQRRLGRDEAPRWGHGDQAAFVDRIGIDVALSNLDAALAQAQVSLERIRQLWAQQ